MSPHTASPPPAQTGAARLLLVEDDVNLRLALCDNLEEEGYVVHTASTGPTGLDAGLNGTFDIIVLDIMLPGIDGYTICRQLRAAGIDAMILMLTARSLEDDLVVVPRTVDNFVSNLKRKLRWSAGDPWAIQTVRGVGYRFDVRA